MKSVKDILNGNLLSEIPSTGNSVKNEIDALPASEVFKCPICQDRGIILEGDVAYPCSCMQTKKLENQFRHARISRELMNCRFDKFRFDYYSSSASDQSHSEGAIKALNAAKSFVKECLHSPYGLGILFTGPVGSGKTYLAASIANELMAANRKVLFLVVPDLLDELRATYKSELNELDLLDSARTIPILILDDLGAHNYTDWTKNRLYSIINYRLNEHLPTVITSNLPLEEMEDYIGLRTTSRIIQSSRIFRLTVPKDIRFQIYEEREGRK
ncbi:DNA replication protein [Desulfosporosinus orientis DSM 765]|uniref:DNA replication protein n=1 Tax=Desulfosporosinus orientis (strain ATCC 19365 / DSM 765 / NCIMB 8382 / VKM B-1628 / Singapore I) TaxID=768706 RepID=G7WBK6_DESOD|nr:ATP-binding protein [Desulfosporosinus orientis]AET68764.1 DNA replication protein [Desulfosporosinus orientis DSM 765]